MLEIVGRTRSGGSSGVIGIYVEAAGGLGCSWTGGWDLNQGLRGVIGLVGFKVRVGLEMGLLLKGYLTRGLGWVENWVVYST